MFLVGLAHILLLPPWEGFDETAHWSSIATIARDGHIPVYGRDRLAAAIDGYPGPLPYAAGPPFAANGGATYRSFTPGPQGGPHDSSPPPDHAATGALNWQAQHPPLYYLLMAPVFLASQGLDWAGHLLMLRLASWLLAFTGFALGVEATRALLPDRGGGFAMVMAAWPFLVPQFFPEMARMGNDSLCLLLFGTAWALLLRLAAGPCRRDAALLGLVLGLGMLTKAFFLPLAAGTAAWLACRGWSDRRLWPAGLIALPLAAAIGGGWYLYSLVMHGSLTGSDEMIRIGQQGGVWANLTARFSLAAAARGIAAIAATFAWAGTWSLARPPAILLAGPVLLVALLAGRWLWQWNRLPPALRAPAFLLAPMLAGLLYHLMVRIAFTGEGVGTPGWYLHILAPALAAAAAAGWAGSRLAPWLAAYGLLFTLAAWAMQLALFSGCATKAEGTRAYDWSGGACLVDLDRLAVIAFPKTGLWALGLGAACGLAALAAYRARRPA